MTQTIEETRTCPVCNGTGQVPIVKETILPDGGTYREITGWTKCTRCNGIGKI